MNLILGGVKVAMGRLSAAVERNLRSIPPDRLLPPPATIAAPAALQYALLGDGDEVAELREMFEKLLATSMDRDTATRAHPAFVSMISQMTQDDARILKSIDENSYAAFNVLIGTLNGERSIGIRTLLGDGAVNDEARRERSLSNLDRLGIIRIDWAQTAHDTREYGALTERIDAEFRGIEVNSRGGAITVTPLGEQFIATCVLDR